MKKKYLKNLYLFIYSFLLLSCQDNTNHKHIFEIKENIPPTCTEEGRVTYICQCGETFFTITSAIQHKGDFCYRSGECINCQQHFEVLGHNYDNGVCKNCNAKEFLDLQYEIVDEKYAKIIGFTQPDGWESIILPEIYQGYPIKEIGNRAFYQAKFNEIYLSSSIEIIAEEAFLDSFIPNIYLGEKVKIIKEKAFASSDLIAFYIPHSVESISSTALYNNKHLNYIEVAEKNDNYISLDGVLFSKNKKEIITYPMRKKAKHYEIPNSVNKISSYCFYGALFESIDIPETVTFIDNYAFASSSILKLELPNNLVHLGDNSFFSCAKLENVILGNKIEFFGENIFNFTMFYNNLSWDNNQILYIGNYIVDVAKIKEDFVVKEGVVAIASKAFAGEELMTSITLPSTLIGIGKDCFYNCSSLENIFVNEGNQYFQSLNGDLYTINGNELIWSK